MTVHGNEQIELDKQIREIHHSNGSNSGIWYTSFSSSRRTRFGCAVARLVPSAVAFVGAAAVAAAAVAAALLR